MATRRPGGVVSLAPKEDLGFQVENSFSGGLWHRAGIVLSQILPILYGWHLPVKPYSLVRSSGWDMSRIKSRVNVRIPQTLLTEVVEHVPVHELAPPLSSVVGVDAIVVDVSVALLRKQVEGDEPEYVLTFFQYP